MKVSDQLFLVMLFLFFLKMFSKNSKRLNELGVNPNSGGDILDRVSHDSEITEEFNAIIERQADLYMVDVTEE